MGPGTSASGGPDRASPPSAPTGVRDCGSGAPRRDRGGAGGTAGCAEAGRASGAVRPEPLSLPQTSAPDRWYPLHRPKSGPRRSAGTGASRCCPGDGRNRSGIPSPARGGGPATASVRPWSRPCVSSSQRIRLWCARGSSGCSRAPGSPSSAPPSTPSTSSDRHGTTGRTSSSPTSRCRPAAPTTGCARRWRSASSTRGSASSSCPSSSRTATSSTWSGSAPTASATC